MEALEAHVLRLAVPLSVFSLYFCQHSIFSKFVLSHFAKLAKAEKVGNSVKHGGVKETLKETVFLVDHFWSLKKVSPQNL